ncbi:hypothetical protein L6452_02017 [Arctium lappa]|uniref:Uncharacterized protein n=1 Tax=Arctium lappa TaxID=4217 RepID=A0ACB9FID8_ARCLA|nr:hypothetical protein L6452_02017 [Arctium lappa]
MELAHNFIAQIRKSLLKGGKGIKMISQFICFLGSQKDIWEGAVLQDFKYTVWILRFLRVLTIIIGMDVSHGSPGRADVPSIVAVVGSRNWLLVSRNRASVRTQSTRVEMIDGLFKPVSNDKDEGMTRELLEDFYRSTQKLKPQNVIIFGAFAPICYAHLAVAQMVQFVKFDDMSDAASSHNGRGSAASGGFTKIRKLHEKVSSSMFFC